MADSRPRFCVVVFVAALTAGSVLVAWQTIPDADALLKIEGLTQEIQQLKDRELITTAQLRAHLGSEQQIANVSKEVPATLIATEGANATTEGANATTTRANATTDRANATTDRANATTDRANATTDRANATTDRANATTEGANAKQLEPMRQQKEPMRQQTTKHQRHKFPAQGVVCIGAAMSLMACP